MICANVYLRWIVGIIIGVVVIITLTSTKDVAAQTAREPNSISSVDAGALANELIYNPVGANSQYISLSGNYIRQLENTILRLQQEQHNKYKQQALQKLIEHNPAEAANLLKISLLEAESVAQEGNQLMAEDWLDVGIIANISSAEQALEAYQQAIKLDSDNIEAWSLIGNAQRAEGMSNEAEQAYQRVLELAGDDKYWQASAYGSLGTIYYFQGNFDRALEGYRKGLEISEALDNGENSVGIYIGLGNTYVSKGERERALDYYGKALEISEALDYKLGIASTCRSMGMVYLDIGEFKQAKKLHHKALKIYKDIGNKFGIAASYSDLGSVYISLDNLRKAKKLQSKALILHEEMGDDRYLAVDNLNLGTINDRQGNIPLACQYYKKGVEYYNKSTELFKKVDGDQYEKLIQDWVDYRCR